MTIKIIKAVNLQPLMCFIFILFSYSFFYIYIYCTSDFNTGVTHAFRNSIRLLEEICAPRGSLASVVLRCGRRWWRSSCLLSSWSSCFCGESNRLLNKGISSLCFFLPCLLEFRSPPPPLSPPPLCYYSIFVIYCPPLPPTPPFKALF